MNNWSMFEAVGNELKYLTDAFNSGWVSGGGYVEKLELELSGIFKVDHAIAVANGTLALQLAFQALGIKSGDKVIVPAFAFQAAANVLLQLGAIPVFCDVDPSRWNQSLDKVKEAFCKEIEGVVGVVVVHNYGFAAEIEEISSWTSKKGLWVIEDCAEAWFSKYNDEYLGTFGTIATFSMHATKTISSGEGGVVLTNDKGLNDKARLIASHGLNRSKKHYLHEVAGNNYRLSNLLCAIAYAQLENRKTIEKKQLLRAKFYTKNLEYTPLVTIQKGFSGSKNNIWAFSILVKFDWLYISRDEFIERLNKLGIETRPGFYTPASLTYYDQPSINKNPVSEKIAENLIVLPCSSSLTNVEIEKICSVVKKEIKQSIKAQRRYTVLEIQEVSNGKQLLKSFCKELIEGSRSFRYFDKRPIDIIDMHLYTILLAGENGKIIGYGHLDREDGVFWLGIAISDNFVNQGWGSIIISKLLSRAKKLNLPKISLKVDTSNSQAIQVYKRFGFKIVTENKVSIKMEILV